MNFKETCQELKEEISKLEGGRKKDESSLKVWDSDVYRIIEELIKAKEEELIMGIYMISTKEIVESLDEALDNIRGYFTNQQLQDALDVMKLYPFICDKKKSAKRYRKAIEELSKAKEEE